MRGGFNKSRRQDRQDIASRRFNVPVRKQGGGARMAGAVRVLVNQFMQRGTSRHRVQQQDKTYQQRGDDRVAAQLEMAFCKLQIVCILANTVPDASG